MNRLKIEYGAPEYVVKEKDKVVVCYLPYTIRNWDSRLLDNINILTKYEINAYKSTYDYVKVRTVVRCKGDDVFDVQKGKKIALAKAENKVEIRVVAILNRLSNFFIESALVMKQRMIDSANNIKHNTNYISKF